MNDSPFMHYLGKARSGVTGAAYRLILWMWTLPCLY